MTKVEAIYENGVLRPVTPLPLEEHERVEVLIQPARLADLSAFEGIIERREELRRLVGTLPCSGQLIAEDRMREI